MTDNTAIRWRKASASASNGSCVELADLGDGTVGVRDSKLGDGSPVLVFSPAEVDAWLLGAKAGEFDDLV